MLLTNKDNQKKFTHKPSPASRSTPWGRPWAGPAWRCTAGQCSPSAAVECCVSAHTAHTPSGSAPPRCSYFQMPWRQPCSVTSNLCTGERVDSNGGWGWKGLQIIAALYNVESLDYQKATQSRVCDCVSWWGTDRQKKKNVRMWEK